MHSHQLSNMPHASNNREEISPKPFQIVSNEAINNGNKSMDKNSRFWDRMAQRYSKKPVANEAAYQRKLQVTREYLKPDMNVLEIGCGTGSTAIAHAPYVKHIHATDISPKMIDIAKAKAAGQDISNVTFQQLAIDELSPPNQSLDVVMGHSILHLLENKDEVISKVYKMLKPGGVFISSTGCLGDSMKFFKIIAPLGKFLGVLPILKVFTVKELEASIINQEFSIDYQWQPDKGISVFIVAKKTD